MLPIWGDRYFADFDPVLARSMRLPGNLPTLCLNLDVHVKIYTHWPSYDRVAKFVAPAFAPATVEIITLHGEPSQRDAFLHAAQNAADYAAPVLQVNTDHFYGNGSMSRLCAYGMTHHGVVVAGPTLRVKRDPFLAAIGPCPESDEITRVTLETLIDCQRRCYVNVDRNASFAVGLSLQKIDEHLTLAVNRIWAPPFYWPNADDIAYLSSLPGSDTDQNWPDPLTEQGRLQIIGSSDVMMLAETCDEATDAEHNWYPSHDGMAYNQDYRRSQLSMKANRRFIVALRA